MTKGVTYTIPEIQKRAKDFNANIHEFGPEIIGENILIAKDPQDMVATYLLRSANNKGYFYECVYTDYR